MSDTSELDQLRRFRRDVLIAAQACVAPAVPNERRASSVKASEVRRQIQMRKLRASYFAAHLFADPAWDILLALYATELEGGVMNITGACAAAGVAPTTALRHIHTMLDRRLIVREPVPGDGRAAYLKLSPDASESMRAYFASL